MWILLETIFAFALLIITFVYIRTFSAVIRSILPRELMDRIDLRLAAVVFVAPSFLIGLALYALHDQFAVVWVSTTAVYISWGQDIFYLAGMVYYYHVLRRINVEPASYDLFVRLQDYASWPSTDVVRRPLDYLLYRMPIARRWKKTTVLINRSDFHRVLGGDLRKIDDADLSSFSIAVHGDIRTVPHFSLVREQSANWHDPQNEISDSGSSIETSRGSKPSQNKEISRSHIVNRYLHSKLTDEAWDTSRRLCQTPPYLIARSWKSYHLQESTRLRFVALFNTNELLLRLIGCMLISVIRESGELNVNDDEGNQVRLPERTSQWIDFVQKRLSTSNIPELETLRRTILGRRDDFDEWEKTLAPFQSVLGTQIQFPEKRRTVLEAWSVLSFLRNKIIGHGGIGARIQIQPLIYLSAVHSFFLAAMRDLAKMDLGISIATATNPPTFVKDQGLSFPSIGNEASLAYARVGNSTKWILLFPYIRLCNKRMLFFDRLRGSSATYIDYNAESIVEPSLITLETDLEKFVSRAK